jgi:hypothetical protein
MELFLTDELIKTNRNKVEYNITEQNIPTSNILQTLTQDNIERRLSMERCSLAELDGLDDFSFPNDLKGNIMQMVVTAWFVPFELIKWIESKCDKYYNITFANVSVKLLFESDKIVHEELCNLYDRIVTIIRWLLTITKNEDHELNLYVFMSDYKKHINISDPYIGYSEINSGMSFNDGINSHILIFRKEELYKVLIHEILHNVEWDIHDCDDKDSPNYISLKMNISPTCRQILLNEAYTELMANYLHSMFYAFKHGLRLKDVLKEEKEFSRIQANKLMRSMNVTSIKYFKTPNNFVQYTSALSYYIIKYFLMDYIDKMLSLFDDKDKTIDVLRDILNGIYKTEIYDSRIAFTDNSMKMIKNDFI